MSQNLEIRQFNIREADWRFDGNVLSNLRRLVFIVEQQVPQDEEWDGQDDSAWHWLATLPDERPIGTARLLPSGQIGRMAVLKEFRGLHIGQALLEQAVEKARHLGFEEVFLNAQKHALGFYARSGFEQQGEDFTEAGILHVKMIQHLTPLQSQTQRKVQAGPVPEVSIRQYDTAEADWLTHGRVIRSLRRQVLVTELGLPGELVEDDLDPLVQHFHSQTQDGQTIGAIRMDLDGNISRLVVDQAYRHRGTGLALLEAVFVRAQRFGLKAIRLDALLTLGDFYVAAGYVPEGEPFEALGVPHQTFRRDIEYKTVDPRQESPRTGDDYVDNSSYQLGLTAGFLLLRREEEFRRVIQEMCRQATQSIRIMSPLLDHKLFDTNDLREVVSSLARRNKYTTIEILLYDSHRVVKNGHALLSLSRKLPSSIRMKIVHPELRQSNHEYLLVDGEGVIYRQDAELFEGYANFRDVTENNRLGRQFRASWESGLSDPNLRQLKI